MSVDNKREVDVRHMPTVRVAPTPYGDPYHVRLQAASEVKVSLSFSDVWLMAIFTVLVCYGLGQLANAVDRLACVQDGKSLKQCKSEQENDDD